MKSLTFSISSLASLMSPFIEAQFKGVKPLWSLRSISSGSGVCPAFDDSIMIYASSKFP